MSPSASTAKPAGTGILGNIEIDTLNFNKTFIHNRFRDRREDALVHIERLGQTKQLLLQVRRTLLAVVESNGQKLHDPLPYEGKSPLELARELLEKIGTPGRAG